MPAQRMNLRMIKEVLRLKFDAGLSHQQTAQALRISKGVVAKYVGLAARTSLKPQWSVIRDLDEQALALRLLDRGPVRSDVVMPDFGMIHRELARKGVTLMLLWQEYVAAHPGERTWGRTQFFEHYRTFAKSLKRSMRQVHRAGEKLFVDYAGPTIGLRDGGKANVFVAAMGASSYTFACATPSQKLQDWIGALVRTLEFLQGVPQLIVPDNARALIADPDRYEPRASDTVLDFARHYGASVLPARPLKPQDKSKVESAVQVVERWILARLRHREFDSVHEVDDAIAELLPALNERPFQKLPGCRASTFAELDAPALQPLRGVPASSRCSGPRASTSTTTSKSMATATACRTRWSARRSRSASRPVGSSGCTADSAWPCTPAASAGRLHHHRRASARGAPRAPGMDTEPTDRLGAAHRRLHRRGGRAHPGREQASGARLPPLSRAAQPGPQTRCRAAGSGLRRSTARRRLPLPHRQGDPRQQPRSDRVGQRHAVEQPRARERARPGLLPVRGQR